ncbi:HD domain-containing protein [Nocardia shimofusensis]|uniref:HD domain-containing protein n=1 Tax=Nocardia shimofusensis TaxID=228596 RepID=UPI0035A227F0
MGNLKRDPRRGWRQAHVPNPESVADHTCRAAQLASVIAASRAATRLRPHPWRSGMTAGNPHRRQQQQDLRRVMRW